MHVRFFISPTFDSSGIEREMKAMKPSGKCRRCKAVDSESTNYSTEDGWRLLQVLKAMGKAKLSPFERGDGSGRASLLPF